MIKKQILDDLYRRRIEELTHSVENSGLTKEAYDRACEEAKKEYEEILIDIQVEDSDE